MDCTVWIPSYEEQVRIGDLLVEIDEKINLNKSINHNLVENARHRLLPVHSLEEGEVHRAA